jgi:mono/diheme cytochrome c family protein
MKPNSRPTSLTANLAAVAASALILAGCATSDPAISDLATSEGGAQIWAQNCVRCHNIRSPSPYSDAQWEVITLHMRVRANLTQDEQQAILKFLKSAN